MHYTGTYLLSRYALQACNCKVQNVETVVHTAIALNAFPKQQLASSVKNSTQLYITNEPKCSCHLQYRVSRCFKTVRRSHFLATKMGIRIPVLIQSIIGFTTSQQISKNLSQRTQMNLNYFIALKVSSNFNFLCDNQIQNTDYVTVNQL